MSHLKFAAAKRSRYAGYRDAVATVRDKYGSSPDRAVAVSDDAGSAEPSEASTSWFDFSLFVNPFPKSDETFGASVAPASGTAAAAPE